MNVNEFWKRQDIAVVESNDISAVCHAIDLRDVTAFVTVPPVN